MKRQISTILCTGILAVSGILGGVMLDGGKTYLASAATDTDKLITPSSYEQYLTLEEPSDIAISDDFIAIADKDKVHIYDKNGSGYYTYLHDENTETEKNRIKYVEFAADNTLYFLDGSTYLYSFHPNAFVMGQTVTATSTMGGLSCFAIGNTDLYFTSTTGDSVLSRTPLPINSSSAQNATTVKPSIVGTPALALDGNLVYYIDGGKTLYQTNAETSYPLTSDETVSNIAVIGDTAFYTTTTTKDLYAYDLGTKTVLKKFAKNEKDEAEKGYSALSVYGGKLYVVKNKSVCEFDPKTLSFTGYEIGASSTSYNRLQQAADATLYEDKVYTADKGRVSIYDTVSNAYTVVDGTIDGDYIATDGKTVFLAAAHAYNAALYDIQTGESLLALGTNDLNGYIVGVVNVYGKYYFVTNGNQYGCIQYDETDKRWKVSSEKRESSRIPALLAADVQGNLYLLATTGSLYRLTEAEFMTKDAAGTVLYTSMPTGVSKLLIDYAQNVYLLQGNSLLQYTTAEASTATTEIDLSKALVYGQTLNTPVTTVAFGAERAQAYIIYNGNLMISTLDMKLSCMENIATQDVDDTVFSTGTAEFSVVKTKAGTLLVEFDLEALSGEEVFPYLGHIRTSQSDDEQPTALMIGETTDYALLAIFDGKDYHTYLAKKGEQSYTSLQDDDYRLNYDTADYKTGWLSSEANLYKFPYLTGLLTVTQLPKNQVLTIVGEISELDYDYYCVQYDDNGTIKEGYIPKSFINFFDGTPPSSSQTTIGEGQADTEAGWRLAYILLGCAAVIILVDFLILRPRRKDD